MQPDPLGPLIEQLSNLLKFAQQNASRPIDASAAKDLEEKLRNLESKVVQFKKINQAILQKQGINEATLVNNIARKADQMPIEDRKFLTRSVQLEIDAMLMKLALQKATDKQKKSSPKSSESTKKKRQQKFKHLGGGTKKWLPL